MLQSSGKCLPGNLYGTDQNQTGLVKFARKHITAQDAGFRFGHKKRDVLRHPLYLPTQITNTYNQTLHKCRQLL
jgi:hypothetical protein